MTFDLVVFLLGVAGGAMAELLKWWQLRESPNLPAYAGNPIYWVITALMALTGGILALAQGVDAATPLLALNIGISAPLILKGLAANVPLQPPGTRELRAPGEPEPGEEPSPGNFIAGR